MFRILDPNDVIIKEDRIREDKGEVEKLSLSIAKYGQLQPIVVDENNELIAGERRTLACRLLGIDIHAVHRDEIDDVMKLEMEIEENKERKDFTVEEEVKYKKRLHDMKMATDPNWTLKKTAEVMGESIGLVSMDIEVATQMEETPDAFTKIKNKKDAYSVIKKQKEDEIIAEINKRAEQKDFSDKATNVVFQGDSRIALSGLPDNSFNICLSDPPFGIDINKSKKQDGIGEVYHKDVDDSAEGYKSLIGTVIDELDRILMPDSWIVMFCGIEHYYWLYDKIKSVGFNPDIIPMIWYKVNSGGQTMQPTLRPGRCYEAIITAYRGNAVLNKQGRPNVLPFEPLVPSEKTHPLERPLPLLKELIERHCIKGDKLIDPFAGSGSTVVAGLSMGVLPIGIEIEEAKYQMAVKNVSDYLVKKDVGFGEI